MMLKQTPNDTNTPADIDNDQLPSLTPLDNDEEDDCGPVESGPLMNEVRLMSKKGKEPLHGCCTYHWGQGPKYPLGTW